MELFGKVVLITGGARIGHSVALALARKGCDIALTYRGSKEAAKSTASQIRSLGRKGFLIKVDLTQTKDCKKLFPVIQKNFGRLDGLVHLASIYETVQFKKLNEVTWNLNLATHLKSAYELAVFAAPLMQKVGEGRIIYFSDWTCASNRPHYKNYLPYYTSKYALLGLTQALALELAPKVLVNAIAPGPILPPLGMKNAEKLSITRLTPLKKWGGAEEIAKAVLFFMNSDFVTGECLCVDGGRHLF